VWIFTLEQHTPVTYGDYAYPDWAMLIGWIVAVISLLPIPIGAVYTIWTGHGTIGQVYIFFY
jgi:multidrug transporter EmrE-like cation transporter